MPPERKLATAVVLRWVADVYSLARRILKPAPPMLAARLRHELKEELRWPWSPEGVWWISASGAVDLGPLRELARTIAIACRVSLEHVQATASKISDRERHRLTTLLRKRLQQAERNLVF